MIPLAKASLAVPALAVQHGFASLPLDHLLAALCLFAIAYAYAGYPALVIGLSRLLGPRRRGGAPRGGEALRQRVTVLVAAYNEEAVIEEKVRNALSLRWPGGQRWRRLEVVVASDGSTDRTEAIVEALAREDARVRLVRIPENAGKLNALNTAIPHCRGDLVVLSDANSLYEADALLRLGRHFADPSVGVVCGELKYRTEGCGAAGESEGLYWRYEKAIKQAESRVGGLIGANGSIYMIRRGDYPFPPADLMDDLSIPLLIGVRTGKGTRYEKRAVAWERPGEDFGQEYRRKVRIITRAVYTLMRLGPQWIRRPWLAFRIVSHKFLRWLVPVFALVLLGVCAISAAARPEAANPLVWLLGAQAAFYAAGAAAHWMPRLRDRHGLLALIYYFLVINVASAWGLLNYVRGHRVTRWKTIREG